MLIAVLLLLQSAPAQDAVQDSAQNQGPATATPYVSGAGSYLYRVEAMPFTPPDNFGQPSAVAQPAAPQGDAAESAELRRRLEAAVTVNDYRRSYEQPPSTLAQAYDLAVANAEISADSRMGALDGRWRLLAADGTELMHIVLRDPGDRPVEGAWRRDGRVGPIPVVTRSGVEAVLTLPDGVLELRRTPGGWQGVLKGPDGERSVTLSR